MKSIDRFLDLNRKHHLRIYCVGDAMVDEYYEGVVDRISPEFPMSIMTSRSKEPVRRPGGSANVAYQLKNFNVETLLIGFHDDLAKSVYEDHHLTTHSTYPGNGQVPVKRRFLTNGIQVFRHDIEQSAYGLAVDQLVSLTHDLQDSTQSLTRPDAVIYSDYNKGLFQQDCSRWMSRIGGTISVVDPKKGPASKWQGCSVFKPNAKEAYEMSGLTNWRDQCLYFAKELPGTAIVITRGGDGVVGYDGGFFEYVPEKKVQVESVIGAGDCFVSVLTMAIAHGMLVPEAVEVAYHAGSIYVQNRLNRPIVPAELTPDKIVRPEDLVKRDFKLAFTNGCFDILHPGHYSTLEYAKKQGDKLVVAVNSDDSVSRLKGPSRPINSLSHRMQMLSRLEMVDFVISFDEDTPLEVIKVCRPDVLIKGGDYNGQPIVGLDQVPDFRYAPLVDGLSTTNIVKQMS